MSKVKQYVYPMKVNGKTVTLTTDNFVEAHNATYWAGQDIFQDNKDGTTIWIVPQIVYSEEEYYNILNKH